jgi:hypothetical protein
MASVWSNICAIAAANSPLVWLAWLMIVVIGISLIVLFRSRWRHTRAIVKYVAFSLYAHAVLALLAFSTRMLFGPLPMGADRAVVNVRIWTDEEMDALLRKNKNDDLKSQQKPLPLKMASTTLSDNGPDQNNDAENTDKANPQPSETQDPLPEDVVGVEPPTTDPPTEATAETPIEPEPELPRVAENVAPVQQDQPSNEPDLATAQPADSQKETTTPADEIATSELPLSKQPTPPPSISPLPTIDIGPTGPGNRAIVSVPIVLRPQPIARPDRSITRLRPATQPASTSATRPARYGQRTAMQQRQALLNVLGRDDALVSVDQALRWLQRNQESDGSWSAQRHGGGQETYTLGHNRRRAGMKAQTAMTGLAVLAFVGAGHDHRDGPYRDTIDAALAYLISQQRSDGDLSGDASLFAAMYCHGMASLALAEVLAYTADDRLRGPVTKAVQFTIRGQDPNTGSWRYAAGDGQGDMSQFGWQVMLLTTAELSGIAIPEVTRFRMQRFVDRMSVGRAGGLASYQRGHRPSRTMTAESLVCRQFLSIELTADAEREAFDYLQQQRAGQGRLNLYYCYYASLALVQYRAPRWQEWVSEMETTLRRQQRTTSSLAGSWDPDTKWGGYGGRVYSTALAALCLEVFYRYADSDAAPASPVPHWTRQNGRWTPIRR